MHDKILMEAENLRNVMVKTLTHLCKFPAVSPHNGGTGELAKINELRKIINLLGLDKAKIDLHIVEDPEGDRPSLFLEYPGKKAQRVCILTHVDIVPEGDRSLWTIDPFDPVVKGSRLYGRGVSDNGNGLVASLYALKALINAGVEPEYTILLAFVADEEMGSHYGLEKLLERDLFRPDDLVIVPDSGNDAGDFIETAEKARLQLGFTVKGKQVHASMPHTGLNSCRVANMLAYEVDEALHKAFPENDENFDFPASTFEPTKRAANVPNVNTVPGVEKFYFDCRILPSINLDEVIELVQKICKDIESRTGAVIELEVSREDAAQPTSPDSEVVKILVKSIREVLNIEPKTGGIGGGTFAALFRNRNIPAVVWSQECDGVAHMPDEYTEIDYLVNNAKVFALVMAGE